MNRKNTLSAACAALLACALPGAALKAEESPCKADIEKFCKDVRPGEGRILKCLKEHEAELSAGCKAKGTEFKEKAAALKEACQADLDKFCKDVEPGEGRLAKCLKEHKAELSGTCSKEIAEMKEEFMAGHPCFADMEKLCKDVEAGEGRKMKCMKEHEAELSAECKAKIAEKKEELKKNSPCGPDIDKFCKGVELGEGRLLKCLKEHEAELSAECKEKGEEFKEKVADFKEACQGDLDKFCKDVEPGEGRLLFCLKKHETDLSGPCKAKMTGAAAPGKAQRGGPRAEIRKERRDQLQERRRGKDPTEEAVKPKPGKK